jgi:hypothetical protein
MILNFRMIYQVRLRYDVIIHSDKEIYFLLFFLPLLSFSSPSCFRALVASIYCISSLHFSAYVTNCPSAIEELG